MAAVPGKAGSTDERVFGCNGLLGCFGSLFGTDASTHNEPGLE